MPTLNPSHTSPSTTSQYSEVNLQLRNLHHARLRRLTHQLKLVQLIVPNVDTTCEPFLCKTSVYECVGESLGSIMWEGSLALAYFMLSRNLFLSNRPLKVLELGAGTGVAGLLLASAQVHAHITLTDLSLLVPLLEKNIKANKQEEGVCARTLEWGSDDSKQFSPCFDYVLAADVVYCAELIEPLLQSLRAVTNEHSTVVMAYRYRGPEEKRFFALAEQDFFVEKVAFEQDWNKGLTIHRVVDEEEAVREAAFEQSLARFRNGGVLDSAPKLHMQQCQFVPHAQPLCIFTMRKRKSNGT